MQDFHLGHLLVAAEDGDLRAMVLLAGHLHQSDQAEQAEPWARAAAEMGDPEGMVCLSRICITMALGGAYCVDLAKLAELRRDPEFVKQSTRWSDEARCWKVKAAEAGQEDAIAALSRSAESPEERERWLRHGASAGHRHLRSELLRLLREQRRFEEAEPWQRAEAEDGNGDEQLRLARRLIEQGQLEEAEHWFRSAAASAREWTAVQAGEKLARFLTDQGRDDEAEQWRRHAREIKTRLLRESDAGGVHPPYHVSEQVVLTALVTTAVLPFIQTLVSKAAEDAYAQARQLIRRLPLRPRGNRSANGPASVSNQTEARFVIVDDPDTGITLYLSSDVSDEALQALSSFDLSELTARRPDAGRVRLIWHQPSGTWRIRGESDQQPRRPD
ncbi:sel1 repeat family protein [Streptomyces kanamyceticus]|uniref:Sel1 repeat family protein n=1 Tax=Streptomyces kanamyceticus TaxID=1967 RepID=A0A5J6GF69_STRKN|nr:sel1 repeat family protein [Streptomyces kanamyceticus]QEU93122.1 sel1 repeat family protein [Streptomyces kanamyceticus]